MAHEPNSDGPPSTERDPRPVVALPRPGLPGAVIALIGAVIALVLFFVLDAHRLQRLRAPRRPDSLANAFPSPPPLAFPPEAPAAPTMVAMPTPMATALPQPAPRPPVVPPAPSLTPSIPQPASPASPPTHAHSNEPALVFDGGVATSGPATAQAGQPGSTGTATSEDAPITTTVIRNHTTIMPTGTVIPAVLETPIDSTRPGLVRAIISDDARGFDGKRILIPRGSRLIGDYASDIRTGQKRVLVTWNRLIRPDGVAIRIGSPAADALGGSGIPGRVNTYFFQRFATAVLQSALQVGVNLASRPGSGSVIVELPNSAGGNIGQDLIPPADLKPRIKVKEGTTLTIFVAHDLDFSGTPLVGKDRPQ